MNTRLDYLWEKVSLFTQFSDLAKIFEPIFFKISLKTGPIFDHPLLVKIGSEIRKSVQNRKTDIFSSPVMVLAEVLLMGTHNISFLEKNVATLSNQEL